MKRFKNLNQRGVTFLELILGVAIGMVAVMGSMTLFNSVYTTEEKYSKIMELDDMVASLGVYLMKGTDRIEVAHLDPSFTFYDIVTTEDINDKLGISGVDNMNIFRVADSFYSPILPTGFTSPAELWKNRKSPIRATPIYFRNSYTLKYLDGVGGAQILASRCIDPGDFNKNFTKDEVLDLDIVPHIYKEPGRLDDEVAFVRCCPINTDFPNCASNDLLPRIFQINAHDEVKMFPNSNHLEFSYDAAFGIYMESAFNPKSFYLRFNINLKDCESKSILNRSTDKCNKKNTRRFIEIKRNMKNSTLSGGPI